MKMHDIREFDVGTCSKKILEIKKMLMNWRFTRKVDHELKSHTVRVFKKTVARLKTHQAMLKDKKNHA